MCIRDSADTLRFENMKPKTVRVMAEDGFHYRDYTVTVYQVTLEGLGTEAEPFLIKDTNDFTSFVKYLSLIHISARKHLHRQILQHILLMLHTVCAPFVGDDTDAKLPICFYDGRSTGTVKLRCRLQHAVDDLSLIHI